MISPEPIPEPMPMDPEFMDELPEVGETSESEQETFSPPPPNTTFSGAEIAKGLTAMSLVALGGAGIIQTRDQAQVFAAVFNRPTAIIPPRLAAGLEIATDLNLGNVMDALSVGDLLASVGISKRVNLTLDTLAFLPAWLRGVLAVGVVGAAAYGGVYAARQVVQEQQQQNTNNSGGNSGGDPFEQQF